MRNIRISAPVAILAMLILAFVIATVGCVTSVRRIENDRPIDLSGRWNDTDSTLIAKAMAGEITTTAWRNRFVEKEGRLPVIIVGGIRNRSSEHIDVVLFVKDIERALVNSGYAQIVADSAARDEIRTERDDQQLNASSETRARLINEAGADMILQGRIGSVTDRIDDRQVIFYQVDLELIDLESNLKLWIGSEEIRKFIVRPRVRP